MIIRWTVEIGFKVTIESATSLHRAALWRQRSPGRLISACTFPVFNWFFFLQCSKSMPFVSPPPFFPLSVLFSTVIPMRHNKGHKQIGLEFTFPRSQTESQDVLYATLNLFILNGRLKPFKNVKFIDIEISIPMVNASSQEVYEMHRGIPLPIGEKGRYYPINITKLANAWYNSKEFNSDENKDEMRKQIFLRVFNSVTGSIMQPKIVSTNVTNLGTVSKLIGGVKSQCWMSSSSDVCRLLDVNN